MSGSVKCNPCTKEYANKLESQIDETIKMWFSINGLDYKRLQVNGKLLRKVSDRVHMRKEYYKIFHSDMKISEYKHCALAAYWIVKLKPFWVTLDESDTKEIAEMYSYINEYIAIGLLTGILAEFNEPTLLIGKNLLGEYLSDLVYSIKYRDLNKESFIMLLDPFYYLYQYCSISADDSKVRV